MSVFGWLRYRWHTKKDTAPPILELLDFWGEGRNLQLGWWACDRGVWRMDGCLQNSQSKGCPASQRQKTSTDGTRGDGILLQTPVAVAQGCYCSCVWMGCLRISLYLQAHSFSPYFIHWLTSSLGRNHACLSTRSLSVYSCQACAYHRWQNHSDKSFRGLQSPYPMVPFLQQDLVWTSFSSWVLATFASMGLHVLGMLGTPMIPCTMAPFCLIILPSLSFL